MDLVFRRLCSKQGTEWLLIAGDDIWIVLWLVMQGLGQLVHLILPD